MAPESLLTVREAAKLLHVSVNQLYIWVRAGHVPHLRLGDGAHAPIRFRMTDLESWLEANRHGPDVAA